MLKIKKKNWNMARKLKTLTYSVQCPKMHCHGEKVLKKNRGIKSRGKQCLQKKVGK